MHDLKCGRYRHYKGNHYVVLGVASHSETLEKLVVYRADYGDRGLLGSTLGNVFGNG